MSDGGVLVTGGSRGIGAATAVRLAQAGHDLTLAYRQDDSAAQETAARAHAAGALTVPRRCPAGGFPFAAEFGFAGGSRATATARVRCPARP